MVLVVEGSPLDDALIAAVLEGAIQRGLGRDVHAVPLVPSRFLMTGATGAGRARGWLEEGVRWSEVIARLHERVDA